TRAQLIFGASRGQRHVAPVAVRAGPLGNSVAELTHRSASNLLKLTAHTQGFASHEQPGRLPLIVSQSARKLSRAEMLINSSTVPSHMTYGLAATPSDMASASVISCSRSARTSVTSRVMRDAHRGML